MGKNDVSKQTVLVLLVLTLSISVIGTWTVLNSAVNDPIVIAPEGLNDDAGSVQLTIADEVAVSGTEVDTSAGQIGVIVK